MCKSGLRIVHLETILLVFWGCHNKGPQTLGGFKQEKCIVSQFWRLEVRDQGVSWVDSLENSEEESIPGLIPGFWRLLAIMAMSSL